MRRHDGICRWVEAAVRGYRRSVNEQNHRHRNTHSNLNKPLTSHEVDIDFKFARKYQVHGPIIGRLTAFWRK